MASVLEILQGALNCERTLRFDQRRNFIHAIMSLDRDIKRVDPSYSVCFDNAKQELEVDIGNGVENINSAVERLTRQHLEARAKEVRLIKHSTTNGDKPPVELLAAILQLPGIEVVTSASHSILPPEAYAVFIESIDSADSANWSWLVVDVAIELIPTCVRFALPARVNDRLVVLAFQHGDQPVFNAVAPMDEHTGRFWVAWRQEADDASD